MENEKGKGKEDKMGFLPPPLSTNPGYGPGIHQRLDLRVDRPDYAVQNF